MYPIVFFGGSLALLGVVDHCCNAMAANAPVLWLHINKLVVGMPLPATSGTVPLTPSSCPSSPPAPTYTPAPAPAPQFSMEHSSLMVHCLRVVCCALWWIIWTEAKSLVITVYTSRQWLSKVMTRCWLMVLKVREQVWINCWVTEEWKSFGPNSEEFIHAVVSTYCDWNWWLTLLLTRNVDLKRAKTRCWGIWLGHFFAAPVASVVYSAKTQNWLPFWTATGVFAAHCYPLHLLMWALQWWYCP